MWHPLTEKNIKRIHNFLTVSYWFHYIINMVNWIHAIKIIRVHWSAITIRNIRDTIIILQLFETPLLTHSICFFKFIDQNNLNLLCPLIPLLSLSPWANMGWALCFRKGRVPTSATGDKTGTIKDCSDTHVLCERSKERKRNENSSKVQYKTIQWLISFH